MSKGTARRPPAIDLFELERRWSQTFGRGRVLTASDVKDTVCPAEDPADDSVRGADTRTPTETAVTEED